MSKRSPSPNEFEDNIDEDDNNEDDKDDSDTSHHMKRSDNKRLRQLEDRCFYLSSENKRLKSELMKAQNNSKIVDKALVCICMFANVVFLCTSQF